MLQKTHTFKIEHRILTIPQKIRDEDFILCPLFFNPT